MSNPQDKSGPDSNSEQPNAAALTDQENKLEEAPENKVKLAKAMAGSGPNGTSEQP
jgi:hypothetical protein